MSEALRCAHCGEQDSREGFVRVTRDAPALCLKAGDELRIECARLLGAHVPPQGGYVVRVDP